jgi:hypothetical protein
MNRQRQRDDQAMITVTACEDGLAHYVDDLTLGRCMCSGESRLVTECGRQILLAPLADPLGPTCPACVAARSLGTHR